jgi:hypothetical protein
MGDSPTHCVKIQATKAKVPTSFFHIDAEIFLVEF